MQAYNLNLFFKLKFFFKSPPAEDGFENERIYRRNLCEETITRRFMSKITFTVI